MKPFEEKMPRLVAELHGQSALLGSVIRTFRKTAADGKAYDTQHYNFAGNPLEWPDRSNQRRLNP